MDELSLSKVRLEEQLSHEQEAKEELERSYKSQGMEGGRWRVEGGGVGLVGGGGLVRECKEKKTRDVYSECNLSLPLFPLPLPSLLPSSPPSPSSLSFLPPSSPSSSSSLLPSSLPLLTVQSNGEASHKAGLRL